MIIFIQHILKTITITIFVLLHTYTITSVYVNISDLLHSFACLIRQNT